MTRLLTLEEALAATDAIVEIRREDGLEWHLGMILSTEIGKSGNVTIGIEGNFPIFPAAAYGKDWRCWSYTDIIQAMESTPWEERNHD
jgi:hypothetical protein